MFYALQNNKTTQCYLYDGREHDEFVLLQFYTKAQRAEYLVAFPKRETLEDLSATIVTTVSPISAVEARKARPRCIAESLIA